MVISPEAANVPSEPAPAHVRRVVSRSHRAPVTLTVLTITAHLPRRAVALAAALIPLTILQPVFALVLRSPAPALSALHTLNALVIFAVAVAVARHSAPSA